jgi:AcrR family transcriptional regulator
LTEMNKKNTNETRSVRTRQAIIDAGILLFHERGYHATSVRDVVEHAGITKGAFYHHFDGKETLLRLIHQEYLDFQVAIFNEVVTHPVSPREHLKELIACIIIAVYRYREHVTIFHQELRGFSKEYREKVLQERSMMRREFEKVIFRGIESGDFRRELDVNITAFAILGMCSWSYQWLSREGRHTAEEIAEGFASMALDGISN